MNRYRSYQKIVRAANSQGSEKCKSLVSPRPAHWEAKWRSADIKYFLNQYLTHFVKVRLQKFDLILISIFMEYHITTKLK